jgi:hypothetical protein
MFWNFAIGTSTPNILTQDCSTMNDPKLPLGGFDVVISYRLLLITLNTDEVRL